MANSKRLLSIDVFRGLTLVFMVLVNSPGSTRYAYAPLKHASWHGWTPTDLVFPFFIFIVGMAIPYSLSKRAEAGNGRSRLYLQIIRRAALLFLLGLLLNGFPYYDLSTIRIMGILQRIAICYILASVFYLWFTPRQITVATVMIIAGYFVLMKFVPVPGGSAGVLERIGNWGQYIDSQIMPGHLGSKTWEGKSLLGSISALATTLIGVLAGIFLRSDRLPQDKTIIFFVWGNLLMVAGMILDLWFPINQNLWSSSLVLFTGGMALVIFACCYWLADIRQISWWTMPFVIFGMNSILVWVGSTLVRRTLELIKITGSDSLPVDLKTWIWQHIFASWAGPLHGSEVFALVYVIFWFGILAVLYKRGIFFKV